MSDPTREDVIDVLVMSPMTDQMGTSMVPIRQTADAVLALFAPALRAAKAEALREAAHSMRLHKGSGHWNLRDEVDPMNAAQSPDAWLEVRADRIENGDRHVDQ